MKTSEVIAKLTKYVAEYGDLDFELFDLTDGHKPEISHLRVSDGKCVRMSIFKPLKIKLILREKETFTNAVSRDASLPYERGVRKA